MTAAIISSRGWRTNRIASLLPIHNDWLFRPGALTTGLRALGRFELQVMAEYSQGLAPDESVALRRPPRTPVWVREIAMAIDGVDVVVARSLTPLAASHGTWQGMRRLRTRPLADMLYNDSDIVRSAFMVRRLAREVPLFQVAAHRLAFPRTLSSTPPLLARRSVFWRHGAPLIVAECFLPDFWRLLAARKES